MRALLFAAVALSAMATPAVAHEGPHDEDEAAAAAETSPAPTDPEISTGDAAMEGMDHSTMDHSTMDHSMSEGMDQSQMDHSGMDHSGMDRSGMDMSEGAADAGMDGMDHSQMDHGQMDHGQMDHSAHHGANAAPVADQPGSASAPPVPTDHAADAIFGSDVMANSRRQLVDEIKFTGFVIGMDMLEYRAGKGDDHYAFEGGAWFGGDIDRAVVDWSGEGAFGESPESIEVDAYWRHAINPWFNLQLGARHDFRPDPERTYALVGIQGLAPYWIEVEAQAFVSDKGDVHLRGTAAHDMRLTQRLVFEPEVELDVAMQDVPELGIGSGLEKFELSGRLRYEIERNFAPYVGVAWERKVGDSADYAREEGENPSQFSWIAGLRFWF